MTDSRLAGSYTEVLGGGTPESHFDVSYLEVLATEIPTRRVAQSYAEVLANVEIAVAGTTSIVKDSSNAIRPVWRWDGTNLLPVNLALSSAGGSPTTFDLMDVSPLWWYRAKDQMGADGSAVTSIPDASGNGYDPLSIAGTTVKTTGTTLVGKSLGMSGLVSHRNNRSILPRMPGSLLGKVTTSNNNNPSYNGDQLVDNMSDWGWASGTAPTVASPHWAMFGPLDPPRVLTSYKIKNAGITGRSPKDWKWQGSQNADGPWVDLQSIAGVTLTNSSLTTYNYPNTTAYAYYRILITATTSDLEVHLDEIQLGDDPNLGYAGAEMWIVYKVPSTADVSAFKWGTSGQQNHWQFSSSSYSDFGETVRVSYTTAGVPLLNTWRVIRLRTTAASEHQEWIDGVRHLDRTGIVRQWTESPTLWTSGTGEIAEIFMTPELTESQAAQIYEYLNTEHGLAVPPLQSMNESYAQVVADDNPIGFWGLDELAGTSFNDSSGNARHMTINGTPALGGSPALRLNGKSITLNSQTQYGSISTPAWAGGLIHLSVEAMFKTTYAGAGALTIVAMDDVAKTPGVAHRKFSLAVSGDGKPYFGSYTTAGANPYAMSSTAFNDGQWHHVVGTRTDKEIRIYVDGNLMGTQAIVGTLSGDNSVDLTIGVARNTNNVSTIYPFAGSLDAVELYDTALSPARVISHYLSAINPQPSVPITTYSQLIMVDEPLVYWRMDDVTSSTLVDTSGYLRDATATNVGINGDSLIVGDSNASRIFPGSNYAQVPAAKTPTPNQITIEALIKPSAVTTTMSLVDRDDGSLRAFQYRVVSDGSIQFIWWTSTGGPYFCTSPGGLVVANEKYHVAVTYDSSVARLYINAVEVASTIQAGSLITIPSLGLRIGANQDPVQGISAFSYKGLMDEVAIYGTALSPAKISARYNKAFGL